MDDTRAGLDTSGEGPVEQEQVGSQEGGDRECTAVAEKSGVEWSARICPGQKRAKCRDRRSEGRGDRLTEVL